MRRRTADGSTYVCMYVRRLPETFTARARDVDLRGPLVLSRQGGGARSGPLGAKATGAGAPPPHTGRLPARRVPPCQIPLRLVRGAHTGPAQPLRPEHFTARAPLGWAPLGCDACRRRGVALGGSGARPGLAVEDGVWGPLARTRPANTQAPKKKETRKREEKTGSTSRRAQGSGLRRPVPPPVTVTWGQGNGAWQQLRPGVSPRVRTSGAK